MRLIDRYLGRAVILGSVTALLILAAIASLLAFINEVDDIDSGYSLLEAALYVLLTLPQRLYELFPAGVLIGGLMSLGALAAHSELVVIRAAGVSIPRIVGAVLKAGLLITIVAVLLGEFVAPEAERRADALKSAGEPASESDQASQLIGEGLWARNGDRFIHVGHVYPDLRLADVRVYRIEGQQLVRATYARAARYENGRWVLLDVRSSIIGLEGVETTQADREEWAELISPTLFKVLTIKPQQMSAWTLYRYIGYLEANGLAADAYRLAFWSRLAVPLSALVMLLLATPFAFGALRSSNAGQRLFIGIVIGLAFYLFNQIFGHLSRVYGLPPWIGAFLPLLVFLALGLVALRRVR